MPTTERTFIAVKPDDVQHGFFAEIIDRFETRDYKLVAIKIVQPTQQHLEVHYLSFKSALQNLQKKEINKTLKYSNKFKSYHKKVSHFFQCFSL